MENGNNPMNENKRTGDNGDKPTGGNSTFTRIDGIILTAIIIISVGTGAIYFFNMYHEGLQVFAAVLSLCIFALLSIEKIWEKSDKRWKPHQSIRIGSFVLASLLFTYVTLHEIETDTDIKEKIGSADTNITNAIGKADTNIAGKIEAVDTNITNAIGKADTNIAGKIGSADTNITNAIGKADTNIAGKIEAVDTNISKKIKSVSDSITKAGSNITDAIGKADTNIAGKIEAVDTNISKKIKSVSDSITKAGSNITDAIGKADTNITKAIDSVHISIKSLEGKIAGQNAQYQKRHEDILEALQQIRDSIRKPSSDTSSQKEEPQPQNGG